MGGGLLPFFFLPHKWTADNCSVYVASVKGTARQDALIPRRIGEDAAPTRGSRVFISRAHNATGSLSHKDPQLASEKKGLFLEVASRDIQHGAKNMPLRLSPYLSFFFPSPIPLLADCRRCDPEGKTLVNELDGSKKKKKKPGRLGGIK